MFINNKLSLLNKLQHIQDILYTSNCALIGSYHHGNLGDMTLSHTLKLVAKNYGIKTQKQIIYNLQYWKQKNFAIIGGGSTLHKRTIPLLVSKYGEKPEKVFVLGVDYHTDLDSILENITFFRSLGGLTLRSKQQLDALLQKAPFLNVKFQPDICFALPRLLDLNFLKRKRLSKIKIFGFNVRQGNQKYNELVKNLALKAQEEGYYLVSIPFTPDEHILARNVFKDVNMNFYSYSFKFLKNIKRITSCDIFFATCYHAKIFSYVTQTPCIPYFYAPKDYWLYEDLKLQQYLAKPFGIYDKRNNYKLTLVEDSLVNLTSILPTSTLDEFAGAALSPLQETFEKIHNNF